MASIRKRGNKYHVQIRKQGHPALTQSFFTKASSQTWAKNIESDIERELFFDISAAKQTPLTTILIWVQSSSVKEGWFTILKCITIAALSITLTRICVVGTRYPAGDLKIC